MFLPTHSRFNKQFCSKMLMSSKHFLKFTPLTSPLTPFSRRTHLSHTYTLLFSTSPSKPISNFQSFSLINSGFSSISHVSRPVSEVYMETPEVKRKDFSRFEVLKHKMEEFGIDIATCKPGQYNYMLCPMCKGGKAMESSLSVYINLNRDFSMWRCFRGTCAWAGQALANNKEACNGVNQISPGFEPLGDEVIAYFAGRRISERTLKRNAVMQVPGDQNVIAFIYRQDGVHVGCKYRTTVGKRKFWQEKGTGKALYGLDDIKEATEIIIVEGELDKLSMEEAGFTNCVSVPGGAPQKVSSKELPPLEKDTAFQYLWNCKEYFGKASRIIIATDGDLPGQALTKELARRLGEERCWRVSWPKKDEFSCFKDANEVLMALGADSLKEIIENAKLCQLQSSN